MLVLVLFCLLTFAGMGSYYSHRLKDDSAIVMAGSFILLIVVLLATLFLTGWIFDAFLKESLPVRVVISVLVLAPSCFLMGLPFPLGMRIANASSPEIVPWG